jgi:hypothetical protein
MVYKHQLLFNKGLIDRPWENVNISDAKNTSPWASEPFAVLEADLENTIKTLRFVQVTYGNG